MRVIYALLLTFFITNPAFTADYQTGVDAVLRGDYATAFKQWDPLARQGDASPQFQLGWLYLKGYGVPQDNQTAVKWFKLAAVQGYAYAQSALGRMYQQGSGISQDYARAYMWFSIAAKLWDQDASRYRDDVAKLMSPTQLQTARNLANECVRKSFKDC